MKLIVEKVSSFAAQVAVKDADPTPQVVSVAMCDSSVSLTARNITIHVPWSQVVLWLGELAKSVESNK